MINIELKKHKIYPWYSHGRATIRGEFYYEGKLYSEFSTDKEFENICSDLEDRFTDTIKEMNGNFCLLYEATDRLLVVSDRTLSFPILYAVKGEKTYVSDDIVYLKNELDVNSVDFNSAQEFIAAGFICGNKTLYDNIRLIQAGEYIEVSKKNNSITRQTYFLHRHSDVLEEKYKSKSIEEYCREHEKVLDNVFARTIERLRGRNVVLFLSGGYDSRLIAVMLHKMGYKNVQCVSFGSPDSREVRVAREVANSLDYPFILIERPSEVLKPFFAAEEYTKFLMEYSYGYCISNMQGLTLKKLQNEGMISENSVVITGHSGDVIEGDQFNNTFEIEKKYNKDDIIDAVLEKHYTLFGKDFSLLQTTRKNVRRQIPDKEFYSYSEVQDLLELFNWRERQAKYVISDVRCYDGYLDLSWLIPLWDNELVDFWLEVPTELRNKRKLYYWCVKKEKLPTANVPTRFYNSTVKLKKKAMWLVKVLYPMRKVYLFIRNKNHAPYGVSLYEFIRIINITKGYRTENTTCEVYNYVNKVCKGEFLPIRNYLKENVSE